MKIYFLLMLYVYHDLVFCREVRSSLPRDLSHLLAIVQRKKGQWEPQLLKFLLSFAKVSHGATPEITGWRGGCFMKGKHNISRTEI